MTDKESLEHLDTWDFPDTRYEPDGYDIRSIPDATPENMEFLMRKINVLIDHINELREKS